MSTPNRARARRKRRALRLRREHARQARLAGEAVHLLRGGHIDETEHDVARRIAAEIQRTHPGAQAYAIRDRIVIAGLGPALDNALDAAETLLKRDHAGGVHAALWVCVHRHFTRQP